MMAELLDLADGCSGCDGCGTPGPFTAFGTGLLALLLNALGAFLLVERGVMTVSVPMRAADQGPARMHVEMPVLVCAIACALLALVGLAVMVRATVGIVGRRTEMVAPALVGLAAIVIGLGALVLGFSMPLPRF